MKTLLLIVVIFGVIGAGVFIYASSQKSSGENMMTNNESVQQTNGSMAGEEKMIKQDSRYVEYSKVDLESTQNTRRVLFFYANWCPTCRPADSNFSQNESRIPADVTLLRVNYNDTETDQEEKDLATKYGVTYQHTFVQIDENDNVVTKWNGGQIDQLLQKIQ